MNYPRFVGISAITDKSENLRPSFKNFLIGELKKAEAAKAYFLVGRCATLLV